MTESEIRRKYGEAGLREYRRRRDEGESHDFILSAMIGYATDSALLGGLLGGDMLGGFLGDALDGDLFD